MPDDFLHESQVMLVAGFIGDNMSQQWTTKERHITDYIQNLMADKLVGKA